MVFGGKKSGVKVSPWQQQTTTASLENYTSHNTLHPVTHRLALYSVADWKGVEDVGEGWTEARGGWPGWLFSMLHLFQVKHTARILEFALICPWSLKVDSNILQTYILNISI